MLNIPYPYEEGMAEQWIATHQECYEKGEQVNLAIILRADQALIGAMGLQLAQQHAGAELGYWIGKPFWHRGYCTEAAQAVVRYGLMSLDSTGCTPPISNAIQPLGGSCRSLVCALKGA